jgi:hypothetical protein
MTVGDQALMRATFAQLTALGDGPFKLGRDVTNVAKDKRKRYSSDLDAAPAVLPAGSVWVLSRYSEVWDFWCKSIDTRVRFHVRIVDVEGVGLAWAGHADGSMVDVTSRAVLAALEPTERTVETARAALENSLRSWVSGWDILSKLHEQGKISLADIDTAVEAVEAVEAEKGRA